MSTTGYVPPPDQAAAQHEGTSSLAINNTFPRRLMTLIALKTSARFYKHDGPCIPISKSLIVKKGPFVHLTEAATMQFVAANTSIPVSTVHCSFVHKNRAHIVMQRIREKSIADAWRDLSDTDRSNIFAQLRRMFQKLRSLTPPPNTGVQSCIGGSLRDSRIPRSRPRFGPFKTVQEFHRWLREDFQPEDHPDRADDQVVGIIDWEFAGWYPYYWEYTSAWLGNLIRQGWQESLTEFLNAYPTELEMEKTRDRWWGDL